LERLGGLIGMIGANSSVILITVQAHNLDEQGDEAVSP
jgi:hypothetical protein